ncbi:MAG: bifunctional folylpolyglutamate synthase/dihydrofolate synthase [Deltaproteobacteria bacterium]|jgi:dihydrofolate synthase/folylpolyglutamate synthase|nr:bifunctional folylpolyglutamate synthase/dihydrofolate synthase [Deltaproteobacteria bacterium]
MEDTVVSDHYGKNIAKLFDLQKFGMKFGLDSMNQILENLGRPHEGLKFVHLAGTNGKGSTAAMLAEGLRRQGLKTGLYTSPHLITFRERIQINGQFIGQGEVIELVNQVWPATDPASPPTFFEFVTAMAFLYFKQKGVDLAVIETGLGGRLDSTNVIRPLLSAITNVSLEHTDHLGTTIEEITFEKAGVIKRAVPFVGGRYTEKVSKLILEKSQEMNCPSVMILGRDYQVKIAPEQAGAAFGLGGAAQTIDYIGPKWQLSGLPLALTGPYQADNGAMALAMAETLAGLEDLGFELKPEIISRGLSSVKWPGRAEVFAAGTWPAEKNSAAPLILDGAHNPAGALALTSLLKTAPRKKLHLVVGVMADKDIAGVLAPVLELADCLYLTRPAYHRAADPELLLSRLTKALGQPKCPYSLHPTIPQALAAAAQAASPEDLVVVSGSLFTVGETRAYLTGAPAVESN